MYLWLLLPSESSAVAQGDEVQGWLALPDGEEEGPYPTILHTHGGPTSIQMQSFNPAAQAWLDAGFAWCSINYHGSTDFGSAWEQSICKCSRSLFRLLSRPPEAAAQTSTGSLF